MKKRTYNKRNNKYKINTHKNLTFEHKKYRGIKIE